MKYLYILPFVMFLNHDGSDDIMAFEEAEPQGHFLCYQKSIKQQWLEDFFQCSDVEVSL